MSICKCKEPTSDDVITYGGDRLGETCRKCLEMIKVKCFECNGFFRDIAKHKRDKHPPADKEK